MKPAIRLTGYFLLSVGLAFAGCAKKPQRPNPYQTIIGQMGDDTLQSQRVGDLFDPTAQNLEQRSENAGEADFATLADATVFFDFDSAAIRVAERAKLNQAADYVKATPGARLMLQGHCDWRGTTEYNMGLGDRRARAVKDFLVTLGVSDAAMETVSKGDLDAKEGATEAEMQADRRVQVGVMR